MDVINRCSIDYSYRLSAISPMVTKTILSNIVSTQILRRKLDIRKSANVEASNSFGIIIYTITISNISEELVENLFFKDNIHRDTKFIENSVTINGIKRRGVNPEKGFYIGNLEWRASIKINFKVLIMPATFNRYIKNESCVEYNYTYNIEQKPMRVVAKSNQAITNYHERLFKKILVKNIVKTCTDIDYIIWMGCNVEIINTKVLNCCTLDFCTILVLGKIKYKVIYSSSGNRMCIEKIFGFSDLIYVPSGVTYLNRINIQVKLKDTKNKLIDKKTLASDSVLLMHF